MNREEILTILQTAGVSKAAYLDGADVVLSDSFRAVCETNACGNYGKCYMCPPDVGEIHELMGRVRQYAHAALYQSIHPLEDSYDYEGMVEAGAKHGALSCDIERALRAKGVQSYLHLGAGGCKVCAVCTKRDNLPCRNPEWAIASLESYGVDVYQTAQHAGLKYINGQDTVTYFGMLLWNED